MTLDLKETTRILTDSRSGDRNATGKLTELVYEELRAFAASRLRPDGRSERVQATSLVHDAYLRLADQSVVQGDDRTHFFALAAVCVRRVLIDRARKRSSLKRGGNLRRITLDESAKWLAQANTDLLDLNAALDELAELSPRQARAVELRFFGGLSCKEVARLQAVSLRTVEEDWRLSSAWLRRRLTSPTES